MFLPPNAAGMLGMRDHVDVAERRAMPAKFMQAVSRSKFPGLEVSPRQLPLEFEFLSLHWPESMLLAAFD